MSWNSITLVHPDEVTDMIAHFSSSCRKHFAFLRVPPKEDIGALRYTLYRDTAEALLAKFQVSDRTRSVLSDMAASSPEAFLRSMEKDAVRMNDPMMSERIRDIKRSLSVPTFTSVVSSRGMDHGEFAPIHFWIQSGKDGMPYLRIWIGFRSGTCSSSAMPRPLICEAALAKRSHEADCPRAESGYSKISLGGKIYALGLKSELRFLMPLRRTHRIRYGRASEQSGRMNGERVRDALAPMLHEIIRPLGLKISADHRLTMASIRDASPLDIPM